MNRRDFLKTTAALSLLSAAPGLSFANGSNAKRVILIRAFGGWDVTFCMDPRLTSATIDGPDWQEPSTSEESVDNYGGLSIMKNTSLRPSQHEFFTRYAAQTVVVNGIYTGSIVHEECRKRILTGSRSTSAADVGALAAVSLGGAYTLPYIDLTGGARVGPYAAQTGILGKNNQIIALLERNTPLVGPIGSGINYPLFTPDSTQRQNIESYLAQRNEAWASKNLTDTASAKRIADLQEAYARKVRLYSERSLLLDNLSFGSGGRLDIQAETVIELMKAGLCHSASIDTGFSWDTHDTLTDQHGLFEALFSGLNVLVQRLIDESLFQDTMIVVLSEMTRTPKTNADNGKDHWPSTSALLISGDLAGGRTLGGTSEAGLEALPTDLSTGASKQTGNKMEFSNFAAGVLHATGVDPAEYLQDVEVLHGIVD